MIGKLAVSGDSLIVVDVQQAAHRSQELRLAIAGRRRRHAGRPSQLGPTAIVGVDVVELKATVCKERGQGDVADRAQLGDSLWPTTRYGVADARQHDRAGDRVELEVTTGGQEREVSFELLLQIMTATAEQRAVPQVEPELASVQTNEVEHGAFGLSVCAAQSPPELLKEQRGALRRAQEQERVDVRHVDALVEEIDREEGGDTPVSEISQGRTGALPGWSRPTPHEPLSRAARTDAP